MVVDFVILSPALVGTVPRPPKLCLTRLKKLSPLVQCGISEDFKVSDKIRAVMETQVQTEPPEVTDSQLRNS